MAQKGKSLVPFLLDALKDNKYPEYLKYTDEENNTFCLILPRMSKNIREKDMQLLKDWHAGNDFDYKNVKQTAILILKRSSTQIELLHCENSEYIFRILQPKVPVSEFIPLPWKLASLRDPKEYISLIPDKESDSKYIGFLKHVMHLNKYDINHPASKMNVLTTTYDRCKKYEEKFVRSTSTKNMVTMFQKLTVLQRVLEDKLSSDLNVQSFLQQLLKIDGAAGYPIGGFLRKSEENLEEWKKKAPKVKVAFEDCFRPKSYLDLETSEKVIPTRNEVVFHQFANSLYQVDENSLNEVLEMIKQSSESADLVKEVDNLRSSNEFKRKRETKQKVTACSVHELLFGQKKDDGKEINPSDVRDKISVRSKELKRVNTSNTDTQHKLLECVRYNLELQQVKKQIEEVDKSIFILYSKLNSKNMKNVNFAEDDVKIAMELNQMVNKRQELIKEEKILSEKCVIK